MSVPDQLAALEGEWIGNNHIWMSPDSPPRESAATASVGPVAKGKFLTLRYTWLEDGPQEGLMVLGVEAQGDRVRASWVDSWHMNHAMMWCAGEMTSGGGVSVKGTYPAPPGPDWGWRIVVEPSSTRAFVLKMFNITPDGEEALAVQAEYARKK